MVLGLWLEHNEHMVGVWEFSCLIVDGKAAVIPWRPLMGPYISLSVWELSKHKEVCVNLASITFTDNRLTALKQSRLSKWELLSDNSIFIIQHKRLLGHQRSNKSSNQRGKPVTPSLKAKGWLKQWWNITRQHGKSFFFRAVAQLPMFLEDYR